MNFAMILLIRIDCPHLPFKDGRWGELLKKYWALSSFFPNLKK